MKTTFAFFVFLFVSLFANLSIAQTGDAGVDAYIEALRADFRADKVALITEAMQFNDKDSKAFWPVYKKYEADFSKINDQRIALIKSYSDKYGTMTDAEAKTVVQQSLDFESQRLQLRKKYAEEFAKAGLSQLTVAKFIQLEHRLDLLVDLKIASELPSLLIKPTTTSSVQ